jgi:DNA-directed RNA polymerase subunit RPC12/RpoP
MEPMKKSPAIQIAIVVIISAFLFILPPLWGWGGLPFLIIAILIIATVAMVRWHTHHTAYRCQACARAFRISAWTDFLSPHMSDRKLLQCPHCNTSDWCQEVDPAAVDLLTDSSQRVVVSAHYSPRNLYWQMLLIILLYAALWVVAIYQWLALSATVPLWQIIKIPVATTILPMLHFIFCYFAVRHAYRSRIYAMITIFVAVFLLLAVWTQLRHLPPTM